MAKPKNEILVCSKCGIKKPIDEFYVDVRHKTGRCSCCKKCNQIVKHNKTLAIDKRCCFCKVYKPLTDFHRNKNTYDGHQSACKICLLKWRQKRDAKKPKKRRAKMETLKCPLCKTVFVIEKWKKRKYCSEYCKNHRRGLVKQLKSGSGENAGNWKGGVTPEARSIRASKRYAEWRNNIFARDEWTCQKCSKKGGCLCAHHIKPFAIHKDMRLVLSNGVTLCEKCHKKLHARKKAG